MISHEEAHVLRHARDAKNKLEDGWVALPFPHIATALVPRSLLSINITIKPYAIFRLTMAGAEALRAYEATRTRKTRR